MSFPFQTAKKLGGFVLLGIFPMVIMLTMILFGFPLIEGATLAIFTALILVVINLKLVDTPFLRMYEGKTFGALTIDSRGKIDFFDVELIGDTFKGEYDREKISVPFNQEFFFRISQFFGKGKIKQEEDTITLTIPKKDYSRHLFKTDYPILIFNRQLHTFITKDWLHSHEKKDMLLALGYEANKMIAEYNKTASGITRYIVDLIGSKLKGQSWLLWILIIVIVLGLMYAFWPQLNELFGGTISNTTNALVNTSLPEKLG